MGTFNFDHIKSDWSLFLAYDKYEIVYREGTPIPPGYKLTHRGYIVPSRKYSKRTIKSG